jgi:hypothetical protein
MGEAASPFNRSVGAVVGVFDFLLWWLCWWANKVSGYFSTLFKTEEVLVRWIVMASKVRWAFFIVCEIKKSVKSHKNDFPAITAIFNPIDHRSTIINHAAHHNHVSKPHRT